jgi:hypothetical protein
MGAGRGPFRRVPNASAGRGNGERRTRGVGMGNGTKAEGVRGTRGRRKGEMHASGGTCERGKGGRDCVTHGTRGHGRGAGRERDACGHERGAGREKDRDACQRGRAKSKG